MVTINVMEGKGTNLMEIMKVVPAGSMLLDLVSTDGGSNFRPAIVIKTSKSQCKDVTSKPKFNMRIAAFALNDVYVFTMMVKAGRNSYFESFMNYHAEEGIGRELFEGFANHPRIPVIYLDENTDVVSAFEIKNPLQKDFKNYVEDLSSLGQWESLTKQRRIVWATFHPFLKCGVCFLSRHL